MLMRVLAIDTSEMVGSVALLADDNLLAEKKLPREQGTARWLAPAVQQLLAEVRWRPTDVQLVAVTVGPGSFTGLRVGITTAKVFAYSVKAEVLGIDTLEAIAAACPSQIEHLAVAMDAQRGQVVATDFRRETDGRFSPTGPWQLADMESWLAGLPTGVAITGPALSNLPQSPRAGVSILDRQYWSPAASAVGRLAVHHYARGDRGDLWTLAPRYSRRSAAEEKWDRRQQQNEDR
jgi:tRNA threonylcarbamoyladenosine biosynthesis protein TsaB